MARRAFTVTGPGHESSYESAALGLSRAITVGNSAAMRSEDATFYVRDADGNVYGYVESRHDRTVSIYGKES